MGERADAVSDDRDIGEIRDDIEQNRDAMGRTLEQLETRLSPDALQTQVTDIVRTVTDQLLAEFESKASDLSARINEQVQSAVHGAATAQTERLFSEAGDLVRKASRALWDRTSQNPAPVALAATAIGLLSSESSKGSNAANGSERTIQQPMGKAGDQISGLKESLSSLTDQAGDKVSGVAGETKQHVSQLTQQVPDVAGLWKDHSLTVGLVAVGLGFVAALTIPQSERERQAMAPVINRAQERLDQMGVTDSTGQGNGGLIDQVKQTGGELLGQAKDAATESLHRAGEAAASTGKTAVNAVQSAKNDQAASR